MKTFRKTVASLLCLILIFGSTATGGEGFTQVLDALSVKASAASVDDLTIDRYYDDEGTEILGIWIEDCDEDAVGDLVIPETIEGYPVTDISGSAFQNCSGLTSITIPDTVHHIFELRLSGCTGLERLIVSPGNTCFHSSGNCIIETESKTLIAGCKNSVIPSDGSVTSIGHNAFYGCTGLTEITIPGSVTSIGPDAFYGCTGLTEITIPGSVTSIDHHAFYGCTGLTEITIPISVTEIDWAVFGGCAGLTSINIPDSVTVISEEAFSDCIRLKSINIPDSVTGIGKGAFFECTNLTSVTIPDQIEIIERSAFAWCFSLQTVVIPSSVTEIGAGAFGLSSIDDIDKLQQVYDEAVASGNIILIEYYKALLDHPNGNLTDVYFRGTEEEWNAIEIAEYNDSLLNARIHFEGEGHEHFSSRTCVENIRLKDCTLGGTKDIVTYCDFCGAEISRETVEIPAAAHRFGEWKHNNPYSENAGMSRVCKVCKKEERIPEEPLTIDTVRENKDDGVIIECNSAAFDEETVMETEHYSGSDVENGFIYESWNIALIKDGVEIQPEIPIILKLKLPEGISEEIKAQIELWHYHDGFWEKMDTWFEGDYICCVTDSLSPFYIFIPERVKENETPATCTVGGEYTEVCTLTFDGGSMEISRTVVETPALGHSFTNYKYNKDATTEKDGTETAKCDRCNATDTRTKPGTKLPDEPAHTHEYTEAITKQATCKEEGIKTFTCECGDTYTEPITKTAHTPGEWEVAAAPTAGKTGKAVKKCTVCGETVEEKELPKINPDNSEIPESDIIKGNPANNEKTYDYKTTVTYTANVPEGGSVQWFVDGKAAGNDRTLTVKEKTASYTVKVVVTDKNGNQTADEEKVTIKSGFFDKLIWFFKHLFNPGAYDIKQ
jgi:hypothetical protein